jgi:hypothetical protein
MSEYELLKAQLRSGLDNADKGADGLRELGGVVLSMKEAAAAIEALTAERDRLSSEVDTLELLRPHWAQGYSSDSVAAQASTAALVAFWEILGVSDQTSAINALKALTAKLATCEKYRDAYAECDRIGTQAVRDLEAKLAKAVEALDTIARNFEKPCSGLTDFGESQHYLWLSCRLRDTARATLAEIEGN